MALFFQAYEAGKRPGTGLATRRVGIGALGIGAVGMAVLGMGGVGPAPSAAATARPSETRAVVVAKDETAGSPARAEANSPLRRFAAAVGVDLSESLRVAGVPEVAAQDYVRQMLRVERFANEISVADRFDLVVLFDPGAPPVLVYAGMDRVGRGDLQFLKYGDEQGRVEWIDARGLERSGSAGVELPVGGRITSGFGTRMHPLLQRRRFHRGIDLAAPAGTPIRAAADGRVVRAGWHGGHGRQIALTHGGGLDTSYSHLSRIIARPGETVRRGQVIGLVGSSGLSTGPHLHFEARRNGHAIDPRRARIEAPVALNAAQRQSFNGQLRSVLTASGA